MPCKGVDDFSRKLSILFNDLSDPFAPNQKFCVLHDRRNDSVYHLRTLGGCGLARDLDSIRNLVFAVVAKPTASLYFVAAP
jgi:hypothetical protein